MEVNRGLVVCTPTEQAIAVKQLLYCQGRIGRIRATDDLTRENQISFYQMNLDGLHITKKLTSWQTDGYIAQDSQSSDGRMNLMSIRALLTLEYDCLTLQERMAHSFGCVMLLVTRVIQMKSVIGWKYALGLGLVELVFPLKGKAQREIGDVDHWMFSILGGARSLLYSYIYAVNFCGGTPMMPFGISWIDLAGNYPDGGMFSSLLEQAGKTIHSNLVWDPVNDVTDVNYETVVFEDAESFIDHCKKTMDEEMSNYFEVLTDKIESLLDKRTDRYKYCFKMLLKLMKWTVRAVNYLQKSGVDIQNSEFWPTVYYNARHLFERDTLIQLGITGVIHALLDHWWSSNVVTKIRTIVGARLTIAGYDFLPGDPNDDPLGLDMFKWNHLVSWYGSALQRNTDVNIIAIQYTFNQYYAKFKQIWFPVVTRPDSISEPVFDVEPRGEPTGKLATQGNLPAVVLKYSEWAQANNGSLVIRTPDAKMLVYWIEDESSGSKLPDHTQAAVDDQEQLESYFNYQPSVPEGGAIDVVVNNEHFGVRHPEPRQPGSVVYLYLYTGNIQNLNDVIQTDIRHWVNGNKGSKNNMLKARVVIVNVDPMWGGNTLKIRSGNLESQIPYEMSNLGLEYTNAHTLASRCNPTILTNTLTTVSYGAIDGWSRKVPFFTRWAGRVDRSTTSGAVETWTFQPIFIGYLSDTVDSHVLKKLPRKVQRNCCKSPECPGYIKIIRDSCIAFHGPNGSWRIDKSTFGSLCSAVSVGQAINNYSISTTVSRGGMGRFCSDNTMMKEYFHYCKSPRTPCHGIADAQLIDAQVSTITTYATGGNNCLEVYEADDGVVTYTHFGKKVVPCQEQLRRPVFPAHVPRKDSTNLNAALYVRVHNPQQRGMAMDGQANRKMEGHMDKLSRYIRDSIMPDGKKRPFCEQMAFEDVLKKLSRPASKETAVRSAEAYFASQAIGEFMKSESYPCWVAGITDETALGKYRHISNMPECLYIWLFSIWMPIADQIFKHATATSGVLAYVYAFGYTPNEISYICHQKFGLLSPGRLVAMADFSSWDGSIPRLLAALEALFIAGHYRDPELRKLINWFMEILAQEESAVGGPWNQKFAQYVGGKSGKPFTSGGNVLLVWAHWMLIFITLMPNESVDNLKHMVDQGLIGGDDTSVVVPEGITREEFDAAAEEVCLWLGTKLEVAYWESGGRVPFEFLARVYPNLNTTPASCCIPKRLLGKLDQSALPKLPSDLTKAREVKMLRMYEKYLAAYFTDQNTPFIGSYIKAHLYVILCYFAHRKGPHAIDYDYEGNRVEFTVPDLCWRRIDDHSVITRTLGKKAVQAASITGKSRGRKRFLIPGSPSGFPSKDPRYFTHDINQIDDFSKWELTKNPEHPEAPLVTKSSVYNRQLSYWATWSLNSDFVQDRGSVLEKPRKDFDTSHQYISSADQESVIYVYQQLEAFPVAEIDSKLLKAVFLASAPAETEIAGHLCPARHVTLTAEKIFSYKDRTRKDCQHCPAGRGGFNYPCEHRRQKITSHDELRCWYTETNHQWYNHKSFMNTLEAVDVLFEQMPQVQPDISKTKNVLADLTFVHGDIIVVGPDGNWPFMVKQTGQLRTIICLVKGCTTQQIQTNEENPMSQMANMIQKTGNARAKRRALLEKCYYTTSELATSGEEGHYLPIATISEYSKRIIGCYFMTESMIWTVWPAQNANVLGVGTPADPVDLSQAHTQPGVMMFGPFPDVKTAEHEFITWTKTKEFRDHKADKGPTKFIERHNLLPSSDLVDDDETPSEFPVGKRKGGLVQNSPLTRHQEAVENMENTLTSVLPGVQQNQNSDFPAPKNTKRKRKNGAAGNGSRQPKRDSKPPRGRGKGNQKPKPRK